MTIHELESYLHGHIPLSLAMQVNVLVAEQDRVKLGAPLAPNINHRETLFGGSASALAILSAWTLIHTKLVTSGFKSTLVIQRNLMTYEKAVDGYFSAEAATPSVELWQKFTRTLQRKGRARIAVAAVLMQEDYVAGHFEGDFVALNIMDG